MCNFSPFPGRNFRFGRPRKNFSGFRKVKKKKFLSLFSFFFPNKFLIFLHFPPSLSIFPHFLLNFPFFYLFFLASIFPISPKKFPGTLPPPPTPTRLLCHCYQVHDRPLFKPMMIQVHAQILLILLLPHKCSPHLSISTLLIWKSRN